MANRIFIDPSDDGVFIQDDYANEYIHLETVPDDDLDLIRALVESIKASTGYESAKSILENAAEFNQSIYVRSVEYKAEALDEIYNLLMT